MKTERPIHLNIYLLRTKKKLTQEELGARCGADKTLVSHWERGISAPGHRRLPLVAAALDTTPKWLEYHQPTERQARQARREIAARSLGAAS